MSLEMLPEGLFAFVELHDEEMQLLAIQTGVIFLFCLVCTEWSWPVTVAP